MSTRPTLNLPKHQNPSTPGRTACAPYNFIPLPEKVVTVKGSTIDEQLPDHDRYFPHRHTGYFDMTLTTKSPLYVRCGLSAARPDPDTPSEFEKAEAEKLGKLPRNFRDAMKNQPDFFYTRDPNKPVIPASSLRGMVRGLLEIVSYGKMKMISTNQMFFRAVGDTTSLGELYRQRMQQTVSNGYCPKVKAGYLTHESGKYLITPAKTLSGDQYFRIEEDKARSFISSLQPMSYWNNSVKRWEANDKYEWKRCQVWFKPSRPKAHMTHSRPMYYALVEEISLTRPSPMSGWEQGWFIASGWIPSQKKGKHLHWIIADKSTSSFGVDDADVEAYRDGGGISDRIHDMKFSVVLGGPGEIPCFYLEWRDRTGKQHIAIGHTPFFRLPYENTTSDCIPSDVCGSEDIDYVDALFGFIKGDTADAPQGSKLRAYASRIFVTDATTEEMSPWLKNRPIAPCILASPKATAFQQYLVQQEPDLYDTAKKRKDGSPIMETRLRHYGSAVPEETVIRGYKRYWHQNSPSADQIEERNREWLKSNGEVKDESTQHTQFKPVKSGVQFTFRVYFENLSEEELGALCWTLHPLGDEAVMNDPQKGYCHSLGMGKPLGMGAVDLEATLHLTDRPTRYSSLIDGDNWQTGEAASGESLSNIDTLKSRTKKFEEHIIAELQPLTRPCGHLRDLKRIGMLLKIMEWLGYSPVPPSGNLLQIEAARDHNTRYMTIELPGVQSRDKNEYKNRPVLPDPSAFGTLTGDAEPLVAAVTDQIPKALKQNTPVQAQQPSGKTVLQATTSPQKKPAKVSFQAPTKPVHTETKRETVTLSTTVKNGKAHVRTAKGEEVVCTALLTYPLRQPGDECRADVTYESGKAVRAVFKGW
ncbi:MAG: TIGR03986 family CRISPR-associated RAMP protein [Acidobacteriia bacterium]|nr:TIGR03986 family CRISPR-associated RAMP protein [Terriglobia bacterium]